MVDNAREHHSDDELDPAMSECMELALTGELPTDQAGALLELLQSNPRARARWQRVMSNHVQLYSVLAPKDPERILRGVRQAVKMGRASQVIRIVDGAQRSVHGQRRDSSRPGRLGMRRNRRTLSGIPVWPYVLMAAAALVLVALLIVPWSQQSAPPFQILSGTTLSGQDIYANAEVVAGDDLQLDLVGRAILSLEPGAKVRLAGDPGDPLGTVTLLSGVGHWSIQSDEANEPFRARSSEAWVSVVGTTFSMYSGADAVNGELVVVHQGQVKAGLRGDIQGRVLSAGERLTPPPAIDVFPPPTVNAPKVLLAWESAKMAQGSWPGFRWQALPAGLEMELIIGPDEDASLAWGGVRIPVLRQDTEMLRLEINGLRQQEGAEWNVNVTEADGDVWLMAYGKIRPGAQQIKVSLANDPQKLQHEGGDGIFDADSLRYISFGLAKGDARIQLFPSE